MQQVRLAAACCTCRRRMRAAEWTQTTHRPLLTLSHTAYRTRSYHPVPPNSRKSVVRRLRAGTLTLLLLLVMPTSTITETRPLSLSLSAELLSRSSTAVVAPAPPSQAQGGAPTTIQLPVNLDTPPAAAHKHFRKTSSWTTASEAEQPSAAHSTIPASKAHSSQPTSARSTSTTASSPHLLPPLASPSRSSARSPQAADDGRGDSFALFLHPASTPGRPIPSQSVSSASQPTHARTRSTSTAISVSRLNPSSHSPSHHQQASISAAACKLTLDELLANKRQSPLSLDEFRRFMVSQYTDEMVEFLLDVGQFKADIVKVMDRDEKDRKAKKASTAVAGESVEAGVRRVKAEKDRILHRFLVAGSEREINLSCDMRTAIEQLNQRSYSCSVSLTAAEQDPAPAIHSTQPVPLPALLTLFDPAVREMYDLIDQGKFVPRFWQQQTRNIDQRDINLRYIAGIIHLTIALTITAVLILTSTVRWYRLCVLPFNFYGSMTSVIAHCGVCPKLAAMQMRIPDRGGKWGWWTVVQGRCDDEQCRVGDGEVAKEMQRTAGRVWKKALLISSLLTAVYVALPSHPLT